MTAPRQCMGFSKPITAIVIGARGGIGAAFADAIEQSHPSNVVWRTARDATALTGHNTNTESLDLTNEGSIISFVTRLKDEGVQPDVVINCTGLLHSSTVDPEKTWRHLDIDTMRRVFDVNTFGVALLGKHLLPLMPRKQRSVFATLSARVGSIGDNRLGGWYSYRASKAAQNMIVKTLALEASRRWKQLICVALHPGTVDSELSAPFSSRVPEHKLFTPVQSCGYLMDVIQQLTAEQTGGFFAWDGQAIEY